MQLQGRNLRIRMRGADVELLQQELQQLGYVIEDEAGYLGRSTRLAVQAFQQAHQLPVSGEVDEQTAALINQTLADRRTEPSEEEDWSVQGMISNLNQTPLANLPVRAFHKGFRREALGLGEGATDRNGAYTIAFPNEMLLEAGVEHANLFIRVYDPNGGLIGSSEEEIRFNAGRQTVIDLSIHPERYLGPTEFQRILDQLTPVLADTVLADISDEELPFLAVAANLDETPVSHIILAAKLERETGLPAEIFYALLRDNLPFYSLSSLLQQDLNRIKEALERGFEENIIELPRAREEVIREILEYMLQLKVEEQFAGDFGHLLRTSPILEGDEERQRAFIRTYLQHEGDLESLWEKFRDDPLFTDESLIGELNLMLELGDIFQSYEPLVRLARQQLPWPHSHTDIQLLATFPSEHWEEEVANFGYPENTAGEDHTEKIKTYAGEIYRSFEARFPMAQITNSLQTDLDVVPDANLLSGFLARNQYFDLTKDSLDLDQMEGLSEPERTKIQGWMRIARLAPEHNRYPVMRELKMAGLDSGLKISRISKGAFMETHAEKFGDAQVAEEVWERASTLNALAATFLNDMRDILTPNPSAVTDSSKIKKIIGGQGAEETELTPKEVATLRELFGSLDFCDCEHCKSFYSAAAYFVDLLQFLKHEPNLRNPNMLRTQ